MTGQWQAHMWGGERRLTVKNATATQAAVNQGMLARGESSGRGCRGVATAENATLTRIFLLAMLIAVDAGAQSAASKLDRPTNSDSIVTSGTTTGQASDVVLIFETLPISRRASAYRIEVSRSGVVRYIGKVHVRVKGLREFHVSPQLVSNAVETLNGLRGNLQSHGPAVPPAAGYGPMARLAIQEGTRVWRADLFNHVSPPEYRTVLDLLEKSFPTFDLRCPFHVGGREDGAKPSPIPGQSVEICGARNEARP